MNSYELYLKKKNQLDKVADYINWGIHMIEEGYNDDLLFELAGSKQNDSIFGIVSLYKNVCKSISYEEPDIFETNLYQAKQLAMKILELKCNLFELSKEMYRICQESDYDEKLMEWYWINEDIDSLKYDNTRDDLCEKEIKEKIINAARETEKIQIR